MFLADQNWKSDAEMCVDQDPAQTLCRVAPALVAEQTGALQESMLLEGCDLPNRLGSQIHSAHPREVNESRIL